MYIFTRRPAVAGQRRRSFADSRRSAAKRCGGKSDVALTRDGEERSRPPSQRPHAFFLFQDVRSFCFVCCAIQEVQGFGILTFLPRTKSAGGGRSLTPCCRNSSPGASRGEHQFPPPTPVQECGGRDGSRTGPGYQACSGDRSWRLELATGTGEPRAVSSRLGSS
jgi:hypothetical protein